MKSISSNQISVLLVDDDKDDYLIMERIFSNIPDSPFVLSWSPSFEHARREIARYEHDIYIIDYLLGEQTGIDLLELVQPSRRPEPFILLTGAADKQLEKKSIELAAADFLVKGTFKADLLARTLYYSLGRKQIEQQRLQHWIELNQTKDEFISLASHQLRTPATGVKQYVGMVLEGFVGDITESQRTLLTKAYESNERQLRIVSDLLKVAQVDAGKVKLRLNETNLTALTKDVIKEQKATYDSRKQKVNFIHPKSEVTGLIDKDRIRMVLENLIDNASKYSDFQKTIQVEIGENNRQVWLRVSDQGVGIDAADQSKLFEKFSRIYNPLSTHTNGTGLGLYWIKKIVDLHGGTIEVSSEIDVGSVFSAYLPKR